MCVSGRSLLIPLVIIVLIGAALINDRLINIPDLGRMTEVMTREEADTVINQFVKSEIITVQINQMIDEANLQLQEVKSANSHWVRLDRAWVDLTQNPGKLGTHFRFSRALSAMRKSIKRLRPAVVSQIRKTDGDSGQYLLFHIDTFSDLIIDLDAYYHKHNKAALWISGRLLAMGILLFTAIVIVLGMYLKFRQTPRVQA